MQQTSMQLQEPFCIRAETKLPKTSAQMVKVRETATIMAQIAKKN